MLWAHSVTEHECCDWSNTNYSPWSAAWGLHCLGSQTPRPHKSTSDNHAASMPLNLQKTITCQHTTLQHGNAKHRVCSKTYRSRQQHAHARSGHSEPRTSRVAAKKPRCPCQAMVDSHASLPATPHLCHSTRSMYTVMQCQTSFHSEGQRGAAGQAPALTWPHRTASSGQHASLTTNQDTQRKPRIAGSSIQTRLGLSRAHWTEQGR
jgi:hypothetical protein